MTSYKPFFTIGNDKVCFQKGNHALTVTGCDIPQWLREFWDFDHVPLFDSVMREEWYGSSTWMDTSWHNDTCPSFESHDLIPNKAVRVWTNYNNEDSRELGRLYEVQQCDLYTDKDGETSSQDFEKVLLSTDNPDAVFNLVLHLESKYHRKVDPVITTSFKAMQRSRQFSANLYDATDCMDDGLDGEAGYIYKGNAYIQLVKDTGEFMVTVGNQSEIFKSLELAEVFLWESWVSTEA